MTDLSPYIGLAAGILALVAFVPYAISILRNKTKPNRATWFIWTVSGVFMAASYYGVGGRDTMWVPISFVAGPLLVWILSIKYGEGGWSTFDRWCLVGALLSAIPLLFQLPGWTLFFMITLDVCGLPPTWKKTYLHPEKEDLTTWTMQATANVINLCAITDWSIAQASLPSYFMFSTGSVLFLILLRRGKTA